MEAPRLPARYCTNFNCSLIRRKIVTEKEDNKCASCNKRVIYAIPEDQIPSAIEHAWALEGNRYTSEQT